MKYVLLILPVLCIQLCSAQDSNQIQGTAIKNHGITYQIESPDLILETSKKYKVIFDIAKTAEKNDQLNSSINTIARFINMHVLQGVPLENLEVVAVIHGGAVKDYTSNEVYFKKYGVNNPNIELIKELKEVGVQTYMCGQSFTYHGYKKEQLSEHANLALSAMTALVYFQEEGYQIINFN